MIAGMTVNKGFALVTGAGSGIGKAIATKLARSGFPVVVNDINEDAGHQVTTEISANGGTACFLNADVSDPAAVNDMFDNAVAELGFPQVLVNNAGTPGNFALLADMENQDWQTNISVHIDGTFYCLREVVRRMPVRGGTIVNIASIAGINGTVGSAAYAAAKAAVINLSKTAAKELGAKSITVNAIAPGMVATGINRKLADKGSPFISAALDSVPTGEMIEPEEIASLVDFLCTAGSSITGQVVVIDGGASVTANIDQFMLDYLGNSTGKITT